MRVGIRGKPGEEVTMVFLINNLVRYSTCKISTSGTAILDAKYGCFPNHPTSSQPTSVAPTSFTTNYSMTTEMIQSSTSHSSASGVVHQKGVLLFSVWLSTIVLMVKAMYWNNTTKIIYICISLEFIIFCRHLVLQQQNDVINDT